MLLFGMLVLASVALTSGQRLLPKVKAALSDDELDSKLDQMDARWRRLSTKEKLWQLEKWSSAMCDLTLRMQQQLFKFSSPHYGLKPLPGVRALPKHTGALVSRFEELLDAYDLDMSKIGTEEFTKAFFSMRSDTADVLGLLWQMEPSEINWFQRKILRKKDPMYRYSRKDVRDLLSRPDLGLNSLMGLWVVTKTKATGGMGTFELSTQTGAHDCRPWFPVRGSPVVDMESESKSTIQKKEELDRHGWERSFLRTWLQQDASAKELRVAVLKGGLRRRVEE
jgi:hypothetical protein